MDVRSKVTISEHLRHEDVQERILQYIQKGRAEATVTISRAAELFGITENKLRDWEEYGFLNPLRPGGPKGRRLYTPSELDKLAIIRELIDAGFAASDIPPTIEQLWYSIRTPRELPVQPERQDHSVQLNDQLVLPINLRIEQARSELFWRYFVSQSLRLSLMLISEDILHTTVGLVLPLARVIDTSTIQHIDDLASVGESLVGWLSQSRSSHTFLTARPSFQYSSDFRVEPLRITKAGMPQKDTAMDNTLIVTQREARPLTLNVAVVETIRRLLQPVYEDVARSRKCFGPGMCDVLGPATDLDGNANYEDVILNGLTDMVVRLGGLTEQGLPRWRSCCLFLPNALPSLSQQQRSLIVRAQSEHAPYVIGVTTHVPQEPFVSSCIKAFQSGHSVYLPAIPLRDEAATQDSQHGLLRSSIAVPIECQDGTAIAVLFVEAEYKAAFTEDDQRVLRMVGRMIRELLEIYQTRLQSASSLRTMIARPRIADTHFQEFLAEDDFIRHVEELLTEVHTRNDFQPAEAVSCIAIDIDNQSKVAHRYGDRMARDLSRAVGLRIHSQLRAFKDEAEYKLYHIAADRFYILLNGMSLEQTRIKAELLKQTLEGTYQIDPQRSPAGQSTPSDTMVQLTQTTVRLGVSSYHYHKLKQVMQRYMPENAVSEMRMQVTGLLEEELALGKQKGGNIVMSWDPDSQGFVRLSREQTHEH